FCSGVGGPFQLGWTDGGRQAVVGEGERLPRTKRGGAGREQRFARCQLSVVSFLAWAGTTDNRQPTTRSTEAAMPKLTMRELAEMSGGEVVQNPDGGVSSLVIDSREVTQTAGCFAIEDEL